jgi:two-component system, cell cycle response regulator
MWVSVAQEPQTGHWRRAGESVHALLNFDAALPIGVENDRGAQRTGRLGRLRHMRRSISHHPVVALAGLAMAAGVALEALTALTGAGGPGLSSFCDTDVYTAVELLAVAVCATRVVRRQSDRLAWGLMTVALVAWTGGDLLWTLWLDNVANPPYPSPADAAYLLMYPGAYASLMLLIRSRLRRASVAQWLDGGVVGLAVAAVAAALVFSTVLAASGGRIVAEAVNLAYPCGDLILLIFIAVAYSLSDWRPGRAWLLLGAAVTMSAVADIIVVYQSANGSYVAGTVLDAMWPASMTLFALAAWAPERRWMSTPVQAPHTILLTTLAAIIALGILVLASFGHLTPVAVGLAAGALILACVRAGMTYVENVGMLRASAREALTDALSGLGNRRALMDDLDRAFAESEVGHARTLVFFDLNGFKRYNDSFGHAAGDALLARIGGALSAAVGGHGHAYRLGGDEFCALLDGRRTLVDGVVAAACGALVERGSAFTIGAAAGIAVVPDDASTASAALRLADERMYADKARSSRGQARDVLMQVVNERTPGLLAHASGVTALACGVARLLGLDSETLDEVLRAAELHDIGKLAIPDEILNKAGPLDESEWVFMRQHAVIGERILGAAPALARVARLVRSSHERWDGGGYPDGLAGEAIPLGARIVFVCDAYDAMMSDRCYQHARTSRAATAELRRHAGTQFDPRVVEALCAHLEQSSHPSAEALAPVVVSSARS